MLKLKAYAKINLNLHLIPKKLKNGLYPIKYVNCQINLFDELIIENSKYNIGLIYKNTELPKKKQNLIYKAAILLKNEAKNKNLGAKIKLTKNIPIKAGFGGGSSNAAVVLLALIELWRIKINEKTLFKIVDKLGKEVYYFLKGGVCEVLKDGSVVNKLKENTPKIWLVLISPKQKKPSTNYMFNKLNAKKIGSQQSKFIEMKKAVLKQNKNDIIKNLHNDFETYSLKKYPEILKIKEDFKKSGALNSVMTGAGLYIVGFFDKKEMAKSAYNKLRIKYKSAILTHTK